MFRRSVVVMALSAMPFAAHAQDPAIAADTGDTGWVLTAAALVLLMTLPGLGLFYGGLVRAKNLLSVLLRRRRRRGLVAVDRRRLHARLRQRQWPPRDIARLDVRRARRRAPGPDAA
jgi:hypothetical protein